MWFALECNRLLQHTDNYIRIMVPRDVGFLDPRLWGKSAVSQRNWGKYIVQGFDAAIAIIHKKGFFHKSSNVLSAPSDRIQLIKE